MQHKKEVEQLAELYCDISNMFLNVKPSVIDRLKKKDVDEILLSKQAVLKAKIAKLIVDLSEKKVDISSPTYPFLISPEAIIKQIEQA